MGVDPTTTSSRMIALLSSLFSPSLLMVIPAVSLYPFFKASSYFQLLPWLLILINHRNFPLFWHIRLLWSVIKTRRRTIPTRSEQQVTRLGVEPRIREDSLPLGKDIFEDKLVRSFFAGPEDCDWNLHMSNSSYAKNVDFMRMEFLCGRYPRIFADGAVSALGAASFTWHKEIPALSRYEIEIGVDSWEESKWINVVAKFKTPSTSSKQILYCTCVSRYVMKSGRKTIPPWLAIATSGYGKENWEQAEELRASVLAKFKAAHELKHKGKKTLKRDPWLIGGGYRKFGIFLAYDPNRVEKLEGEDYVGDENEELGLGKYQDRKNWNLSQFEERRKANLLALSQLAAYPNPNA